MDTERTRRRDREREREIYFQRERDFQRGSPTKTLRESETVGTKIAGLENGSSNQLIGISLK